MNGTGSSRMICCTLLVSITQFARCINQIHILFVKGCVIVNETLFSVSKFNVIPESNLKHSRLSISFQVFPRVTQTLKSHYIHTFCTKVMKRL